jgi:hypothetical protein
VASLVEQGVHCEERRQAILASFFFVVDGLTPPDDIMFGPTDAPNIDPDWEK